MTSYPSAGSATLSDSHCRMLFEESGISPDVAAELKAKTFAKRYVHDRMRELGRIRLELLKQVLRDAGGTVTYTLPAAKSLGCTVERLPEFGNQEFVFAPRGWAA